MQMLCSWNLSIRYNASGRNIENQGKVINDNSPDGFVASNGWLEKWKAQYGIRERRLSGEAGHVSLTTVKSRVERIAELTKGCALSDIWYMDELELYFKLLPDKGLIEKAKSRKGSTV